MEYISEPGRDIPVRARSDVMVAGGGVGGVMAAISAARSGAKTVLAERASFLGAVATMGLPLQGFCGSDGRQVVFGLADEFRKGLIEIGGATDFIPCAMHNPYVIVDTEKVKLICQRMLLEAGVELILNSPVVAASVENHAVNALIVEGKSGREAISASQFIDCTGDADVVKLAGGRFRIADKSMLQAITLNVQMAGVDIRAIQKQLRDNPESASLYPLLPKSQLVNADRYILVGLPEYIKKADGDDADALWGSVCYITQVNDGCVCLNSVHVSGLDPCDTAQLTQIETIGREQAWRVADFMKKYIPGFENAFVTGTGPWAGIRESRIIEGHYTLTQDDVRGGLVT
ncbi:MAG: FAD-dependent oxidoreductase, partial [Clostridia bacterium]|nr:FAD-dependent oxidoreductase [Clostridia bacterium]